VTALSSNLLQAGAPIDRLQIMFPTINPLYSGTSALWRKRTGETTPFQAHHGLRLSERFIGSPLQKLLESGRGIRQSLIDLPKDAHAAFTELADEGFTDYYAMPVTFNSGLDSAFIVSSRKPGGFSDCDINNFRRMRDYVAPTLEVFSLRHLSSSLLDTYLGKRTGEKVLSGMIKRGDADTIHAALWFSDLRDFTQMTENLPADKLLKILNDYFEFVAAAVTAQGGEILRFIGDAMLIVFPIDEHISRESACNAAIDAARDAQQSLATHNHMRRRHGEIEIRFGVGLNVGEVIYGNVGAPDRLDFTVMGPAVNRTARLESLTKVVGEDILVSKAFAESVDCPMKSLGEHMMKGIEQPQPVFAPTEICGK
jgi:adenylate cyclase